MSCVVQFGVEMISWFATTKKNQKSLHIFVLCDKFTVFPQQPFISYGSRSSGCLLHECHHDPGITHPWFVVNVAQDGTHPGLTDKLPTTAAGPGATKLEKYES